MDETMDGTEMDRTEATTDDSLAMTESRPTTNISARLAGPLLASIFIHGGWDAFQNPEGKLKGAAPVTGPLAESFDFIPDEAALVKLNGAVQVGAGVLLATGRLRRLAALVLMGSLVPTTYAAHQFWNQEDDAGRAQQRIQFAKNASILGGLVLMLAQPRRKRR
jgi:putative oxidoreductase